MSIKSKFDIYCDKKWQTPECNNECRTCQNDWTQKKVDKLSETIKKLKNKIKKDEGFLK